jgi:hypothetical protein
LQFVKASGGGRQSDSLMLPQLQPDRSSAPLAILWPGPGNPTAYLTFSTQPEWRAFTEGFDLNPLVPLIVLDKYQRAQNLYWLGWIDGDCIKAGELAALVALELALLDRYGGKDQAKRPRNGGPPHLNALLEYMVEQDGLTNEDLPIYRKNGGNVIPNLYEPKESWENRKGKLALPPMTLVERRNRAAHGDPFYTTPSAGLIEVVRDLIEYVYRHFIRERTRSPGALHPAEPILIK